MFLSILITLAGFIVGLGAVTVIDLHGFLGRKSHYWTEATIRTHKVTKPLIWLGTILVLVGHIMLSNFGFWGIPELTVRLLIISTLVLNGCFLSFVVSPALIKRESNGHAKDLLPQVLQNKIIISFIISFTGWWGLVYLFVKSLV